MESIRNDKLKLEALINEAISEFVKKNEDFDIKIDIDVNMHRHKMAMKNEFRLTGWDVKTSVTLTM